MCLTKRNFRQLINLLIIGCIQSTQSQAWADECGVLEYEANKSSGVSVTNNQCHLPTEISKGVIIKMTPKSRLWLKSKQSETIASNFQLICQNRTNNQISLEFSGMVSPWLSVEKLNQCTGWIRNRLSCSGTQGEPDGIVCVLAFFEKNKVIADQTTIQRTTSVKMRNIQVLEDREQIKRYKQQLYEEMSLDVQICKQLDNRGRKMNLKWTVEPGGKIIFNWDKDVQLANTTALISCAKAVVSSVDYPVFKEQEPFAYAF